MGGTDNQGHDDQFSRKTEVNPDTTEAGQTKPYVGDATNGFDADDGLDLDDRTTQIIINRYDHDFLKQEVSLEKDHKIQLLLASKKRWLQLVGILTPENKVALLNVPVTSFEVEDIKELCEAVEKDENYLYHDDRRENDANELAAWALPHNQFLTHRYIHLLTQYNLERHHEEIFEKGLQDYENYRVDAVPVEVPVASWKSFGIGGAVVGVLTALIGVLTLEQWAPYLLVEKPKPKPEITEVAPELSNEYGGEIATQLEELDNLYKKYRDVLPGDNVKSYKILKAQVGSENGHIQVNEKGLIVGGDLGKYFMKEINLLRKSMENNILSVTGEQATLDQKVNP